MLVNGILDLARLQTHTNDTQVPNTTAIDYLNIVYHKVANRIITDIDEGYFWEEFLTDSVANQNEYKMAIGSATVAGMKRIKNLEVKWSSTDTYANVVSVDTLSSYPNSIGDLNTNLGTSSAFYEVKDGSIFIYPQTTAVVTDGVKIQATTTLIDLVVAGAETTIFPSNSDLRDYHSLLALGVKQYIYSSQGKLNEKNDAINEFEGELNRLIQTMKDRTQVPVVAELPNTSLQY